MSFSGASSPVWNFLMTFILAIVVCGFGQQRPEPSFSDLVIPSTTWTGELQPNYSVELKPGAYSYPPFPRWLPGPTGTRLEFRVNLAETSTCVVHIARANAPSLARLLVDNREVSVLPITTGSFHGHFTSTQNGPLGNVEEDLWSSIPSGIHTVTVLNGDKGWIEIPTIRFGGLGPTQVHMERELVRTVSVREVVEMTAPNLQAQVWGVGLGAFPNDDGQEVKSLNIRALDLQYQVRKVRDRVGQEFNFLEAAADSSHSQHLTVEVDSTVTLYSRTLRPGPPKEQVKITESERRRWTQLADLSEANRLRNWMTTNNLVRKANERDLQFGQRVLNTMQRLLRYKWVPSASKGIGPCLQRGWGACGDLNETLVAALKLEKIPARLRQGRNILGKTRKFGLSDDGTLHVAAEFWAEGVGWVPIEGSAFSGESLAEGGALTPFLGVALGDHLNKHYDSAWLDDTKRSFQEMDWISGTWLGTWDGWKTKSYFGFESQP